MHRAYSSRVIDSSSSPAPSQTWFPLCSRDRPTSFPLMARLTPRLFFQKHVKPVGAGAGDPPARPVFPGHLIPAPFFNEATALVGIYFPEFLQFLFMVRVLHKLGDADRRPCRQDRLFAHPEGGALGGPTTPYKTDDHGDDSPTNQAPHAVLHLPC